MTDQLYATDDRRRRRQPDVVQRAPLDTGDLWKWVDRLTTDRRQRLVRQTPGTKATIEWVTVPSLWTQLEEAVASTTTRDGGQSKGTGSPAPIDVAITSLMHEMSTRLIRALIAADLQPRLLVPDVQQLPARALPALQRYPARDDRDGLGEPVLDPELAGRLTERAARSAAGTRARLDSARARHDVRSDLRQYAAYLTTVVRDQDLIDDWAHRYHSWGARAESALTLDGDSIDTRGIRGHACPACLGLRVARYEDDGTYWDPALTISFRDGQILHATCRVCSAGWWRGEGLEELTELLHSDAANTPSTEPVTGSEDAQDVQSDVRPTGMPGDGRSRADRLPPSSLFPW